MTPREYLQWYHNAFTNPHEQSRRFHEKFDHLPAVDVSPELAEFLEQPPVVVHRALRPRVGSIWACEPRRPQRPRALALIEVTGVTPMTEGEWRVATTVISDAPRGAEISLVGVGLVWHGLEAFWGACHAVATEPGPP